MNHHEPMSCARFLSCIQMQHACDEGIHILSCSLRRVPTSQLADIGGMSCKEYLRPLYMGVDNDIMDYNGIAPVARGQGTHSTTQSTTTRSLALRMA